MTTAETLTLDAPTTHPDASAGPLVPADLGDSEIGDADGIEAAGEQRTISDQEVIIDLLSDEVKVRREQVRAALLLLEDGHTVPFIARYRKEATDNLDEVVLRTLDERRRYFGDLLARRDTILRTIEAQGHLTPQLRTAIEGTLERTRLEDLYLPYRPKRRTRAAIAIEKGVEPLARQLYQQAERQSHESLMALATTFVSEELGVTTIEEVLAAAQDIVAEWIAEDAELRQMLRNLALQEGFVRSRLKAPKVTEAPEAAPAAEEAAAEAAGRPGRGPGRADRAAAKAREREEAIGRYRVYHDFREPVRTIPSHRVLAIRRGAREEILSYGIEIDAERALALLRPQVVMDPTSAFGQQVELALQDAYQRLMKPSIENEVKQQLRKKADTEAIRVFGENLESLLMAPPGGPLVVLGIDPGFRTGCKVAVVDTTGALLDHATIYPTEPRNDEKGSEKILSNLIERHKVGAIAIGNGTASRETHSFIRRMLSRRGDASLFCMVVNESGASVYSASDVAREEFPDLDVTVRGAISIARRLQDPLAELVKIDPRSLGIGQYQHDIDQKRLRQALHDAVESCVNRVGVDLNTASVALLGYVSGVTQSVAQAVVERRSKEGAFRCREDLLKVHGVGPKIYQQAAGFVRIRDGENVLDNTAVHPESYETVSQMAQFMGIELPTLINNPDRVQGIDRAGFSTKHDIGGYTLADILEELARPGRDPREKFVVPEFRDDVQKIEDLKVGMELEGTVTNVANFGAFVDIGVHQDGLVHVSELSTRFVQDPRDVVRVGDIVKTRVLSVDAERKRIALSMKPAPPEGAPAPRPRNEGGQGRFQGAPRHDAAPRHEWQSRGESTYTAEAPRQEQAPVVHESVGAPSGYVPGAWKRSTAAPASTSAGRAKKGNAKAAARQPAAVVAETAPTEVDAQIRALQERFNRNR